jgi:uncharacterized protein (TIGR01244 family)
MRKSSIKKFWIVAGISIGAPFLVMASVYAKWLLVDAKLSTITPGTLYQSAALAPAALVSTCDALGVRTVIDLRNSRPDDVAACRLAADEAGITHVHVPTISWPTRDGVDAFLDAMTTAERPVLVHCHHGEGRSVWMCAIHRIQNEGWSNEAAFDGTSRLPDGLRFVTAWFPGLRRFDAAEPKGRMVLEYKPRPR